jgi:hypothetical protein
VTDQDLIRRIEYSYFRYFRRRNQVAPDGEHIAGFRWRALETLVATAEPELWEAVEINGTVSLLLVIEDAAYIVWATSDEGVTLSVGRLHGGTYEERITIEDDDYGLTGTFRHPNLPGPLVIEGRSWDELKSLTPTRDRLRAWASAAGSG